MVAHDKQEVARDKGRASQLTAGYSSSPYRAERRAVGLINPDVSVIIPVKNGGAVFEECLAALRASQDARYEIIVLNDASTDDSSAVARRYSCRLKEFAASLGPSHARNEGAKIAAGDILLFIDADIIVPRHTLRTISAIFKNKEVVAITGVLSETIRYHNFSSQYKNLWMRYSYLEMPDQVSLFYTSIAAIRKEVFLATGGFDTGYCSPSLEDTDFGQRLEMEGYQVHLQRDLEVEHVKHYTLSGLLRTDFSRSAAMVKMTLRKGLNRFMSTGNKTSVRSSFMVGVLLFSLACSAALAGIMLPEAMVPFLVIAGILFFSIYLLNLRFLKWLAVRRGWRFFLQSLFLIQIDVAVVIGGIFYGLVDYLRGRNY